MKSYFIKVDMNLGDEYCEQYRKLFPSNENNETNNQLLLEAFVKDRLQEELEFISKEIENLESEL